MKPTVYLETSVVSYLAARISRDPIRAGLQIATQRWWQTRSSYEIFVSQFVYDEARGGDPDAAARRLLLLRQAAWLEPAPEVGWLASEILRGLRRSAKAQIDALHVAIAAVHGIEFLLTWDRADIASPVLRCKIQEVVNAAGFACPYLCTPAELMAEV